MIAICYLMAFLIYLWAGMRGVIVGIVALNVVSLGLLYLYPVPGCGPGSLNVSCNFPGYLNDIVINGFRWNSADFDPDGVGVIIPAITSVLFGVIAGQLLRTEWPLRQRLGLLLAGAIILIAGGQVLSIWVPINKQLWTTSYALLMAGLAGLGLACSIWLVEARGAPRWFRPLEILGLNAIAAYLISRLLQNVPRVHIMGKSFHDDVLAAVATPPNASLLFAMMVLAAVYLAVWLMLRRGWYLRL
jgi:predicted acyltransferase